MIKIYGFLFLSLIWVNIQAQKIFQGDTVFVSTDQFTSLNFPDKIYNFKVSDLITDKVAIMQRDNDLFFQFVEKNIPVTKILVRTNGNHYYYFSLAYKNSKKGTNLHVDHKEALTKAQLESLFEPSAAIVKNDVEPKKNREKDLAVLEKPDIPSKDKPKKGVDKSDIKVALSKNEKKLNIINDWKEFFADEVVDEKEVENREKEIKSNRKELQDKYNKIVDNKETDKNFFEALIAETIISLKAYVIPRNFVSFKGVTCALKGVYVNGEKLYVLLEYKSNSPVQIEGVEFLIANGRKTSRIEDKVVPTSVYNKITEISNEAKKTVFVFNLFTLADDQILRIETIEDKRNVRLSLPVLPQVINEPKNIKN